MRHMRTLSSSATNQLSRIMTSHPNMHAQCARLHPSMSKAGSDLISYYNVRGVTCESASGSVVTHCVLNQGLHNRNCARNQRAVMY